MIAFAMMLVQAEGSDKLPEAVVELAEAETVIGVIDGRAGRNGRSQYVARFRRNDSTLVVPYRGSHRLRYRIGPKEGTKAVVGGKPVELDAASHSLWFGVMKELLSGFESSTFVLREEGWWRVDLPGALDDDLALEVHPPASRATGEWRLRSAAPGGLQRFGFGKGVRAWVVVNVPHHPDFHDAVPSGRLEVESSPLSTPRFGPSRAYVDQLTTAMLEPRSVVDNRIAVQCAKGGQPTSRTVRLEWDVAKADVERVRRASETCELRVAGYGTVKNESEKGVTSCVDGELSVQDSDGRVLLRSSMRDCSSGSELQSRLSMVELDESLKSGDASGLYVVFTGRAEVSCDPGVTGEANIGIRSFSGRGRPKLTWHGCYPPSER